MRGAASFVRLKTGAMHVDSVRIRFGGVRRLTAILAKIGIKDVDSSLATAIRTIVVLLFSCLMVFIVGSQNTITAIGSKTLIFLVLSGLATGAFMALLFQGDTARSSQQGRPHRQVQRRPDHHPGRYFPP
jgi:hypothetical protein